MLFLLDLLFFLSFIGSPSYGPPIQAGESLPVLLSSSAFCPFNFFLKVRLRRISLPVPSPFFLIRLRPRGSGCPVLLPTPSPLSMPCVRLSKLSLYSPLRDHFFWCGWTFPVSTLPCTSVDTPPWNLLRPSAPSYSATTALLQLFFWVFFFSCLCPLHVAVPIGVLSPGCDRFFYPTICLLPFLSHSPETKEAAIVGLPFYLPGHGPQEGGHFSLFFEVFGCHPHEEIFIDLHSTSHVSQSRSASFDAV